MSIAILLLSDLSYSLGIIGIAEMRERSDVAEWLSDKNLILLDPRGDGKYRDPETAARSKDHSQTDETRNQNRPGSDSAGSADEPGGMKLLVLNKWHFTLGDVDCVPSVPHGHETSKTQSWPKLNPYTGRVFINVQVEDVSKRLDRNDMRTLWRDENFIERCRRQVLWYARVFPTYRFTNAKRGHLHFPRW